MEQRGETNHRRRTFTLAAALGVVGIVFVGRLFVVQLLQHGHYQALAAKEHEKKFEIPARRGAIYALDGDQPVPLVLNETRYTLYADARYIENVPSAAEEIQKVIGGDKGEYERLMNQRQSAYVVLAKKLSSEQRDKITALDIKGVGTQETPVRTYPEGSLAAQVLGFVNDEGEGQYGIEAALNNDLKGETGQVKTITDAGGIPLTTSDDNIIKAPRHGDNLILTIDRNIQAFAEKALKEGLEKYESKFGAVVVMDPKSGEIKAMATLPSYDPNKYQEVTDYNLFQNAVTANAYEPGSVMKVFTMAAGLNEGVVKPDTTFTNSNRKEVDGYTITNVLKVGGSPTMSEVIYNSLNTGAIFVLEQLGGGSINKQAKERLYHYLSDIFGFGSSLGVAQSPEVPGRLFAPDSEQASNVQYANMSFGQGMTVNMLQAAAAFSALVNGGTYYKPILVSETKRDTDTIKTQPHALRSNIIKPEVSEQVKNMVQQVVEKSGGHTAKRSGYRIGGKTGTAQIPSPEGGYYDNREIGSFLGAGPLNDPRYVIMVRVDEPKVGRFAGSDAAAPIFAAISNWLIDYYQIPPQ